jgi:DNA polymerase-3 subunit delta'
MKLQAFLERMFKQNRVPQALLFYGKEGVGKREIAFELSKALLCLKSQYPACGVCESCRLLRDFFSQPEEKLKVYEDGAFVYLQGDHPDFIYLKPEKTEIKVDQVRAVREFVYIKPALSHKKVVVIYNADAMNPYAQNALLKVLEEPPLDTHFILVSHNLNSILPTIKSRCFMLEVPPLTKEELAQRTGVKDELLLELSEGSLILLESLKEKKEIVETALKFWQLDWVNLFKLANKLEDWSTEDKLLFLKILSGLIHKKYLQEREERYKLMLDRVYFAMEYLGKGINLKLTLFYLYLKGGDKNASYKGALSGH